jgi:hypothetical protein
MKWNVKDVEMFIEAKEYVDTVLVPLIPITFNDQMKQLTSASDFMAILSMEIEKNCKGRILLAPTFYYVNGDEKKVEGIQNWIMELHQAKFKHIYFLTSDMNWKKDENNLSGLLLWIPTISLERLEIEQAREVMKQQVKQIVDIFTINWEN